jgi:hypothetical protein
MFFSIGLASTPDPEEQLVSITGSLGEKAVELTVSNSLRCSSRHVGIPPGASIDSQLRCSPRLFVVVKCIVHNIDHFSWQQIK